MALLEHFVTTRVIGRLMYEHEFWKSQHVRAGDWRSFTENVLSSVFSANLISMPLESLDDVFHLEVDRNRMTDLVSILASEGSDLSRSRPVVAPTKRIEAIPVVKLPSSVYSGTDINAYVQHSMYEKYNPKRAYELFQLPSIVLPVNAGSNHTWGWGLNTEAVFGPLTRDADGRVIH